MNFLLQLVIDVSAYSPTQLGHKTDLEEILNYVTSGFVAILGTFAVLSMLYGAYLYVVSSGNEDLLSRAKIFMQYPILGLVIAAFGYMIIQLVVNIMLS